MPFSFWVQPSLEQIAVHNDLLDHATKMYENREKCASGGIGPHGTTWMVTLNIRQSFGITYFGETVYGTAAGFEW